MNRGWFLFWVLMGLINFGLSIYHTNEIDEYFCALISFLSLAMARIEYILNKTQGVKE